MDDSLKTLAEAGLAADAAEEALAEGAATTAEQQLDRADEALAELRARWADMAAGERRVVGASAAPLRARLDAVRGRLPKRRALVEGVAEVDPEQEQEPGD
jgi:hypothetical protein